MNGTSSISGLENTGGAGGTGSAADAGGAPGTAGATGAGVEPDTAAAGNPPAAERSNAARNFRLKRRARIWSARIVLAVVIFGGWQWFTTEGWVDPFFFGQPSQIWHRFIRYWQEDTGFGSYPLQIETTMKEAVYGFLVGTGLGIVAGVGLGMNRFVAEVLDPFIKVVNAIPRIVLGSIFVVAFGVGLEPKVLLSAVLVFFVVFFNAFQGVREVDRNILNNAKVLGASRWHVIRHVILPSAMTWIIASLHSAFGFAIVGAVVGEVIGATAGLGLLIKEAQGQLDPNGVFANMFVIAALVLIVEFVIERIERRLLSWRPKATAENAQI